MRPLLLPIAFLMAATAALSQSNDKVASGLKEALSVGTTDAVKLTGVQDGLAEIQPSRF